MTANDLDSISEQVIFLSQAYRDTSPVRPPLICAYKLFFSDSDKHFAYLQGADTRYEHTQRADNELLRCKIAITHIAKQQREAFLEQLTKQYQVAWRPT